MSACTLACCPTGLRSGVESVRAGPENFDDEARAVVANKVDRLSPITGGSDTSYSRAAPRSVTTCATFAVDTVASANAH
jgi:hypothetical protein